MRRTHLRGHSNILKRLLIHAGAFNLGLLLRAIVGVGTPRGLQDAASRVLAALLWAIHVVSDFVTDNVAHWWPIPGLHDCRDISSLSPFVSTEILTCTTGC